MSPGDSRLAGDPGRGRPGPKVFVGCEPCGWHEARSSAVGPCASGKHQAVLVEVLQRCTECGWEGWYSHPMECDPHGSGPVTEKRVRRLRDR